MDAECLAMSGNHVGGQCVRPSKSGSCVIFVHGILSSSETAWTNDDEVSWPQLLAQEQSLQDVGIYTFSYRSDLFSRSYSVGDVVDSMREFFNLNDIWRMPHIIFVCHSLGGIVVRRFIVVNQIEFLRRHTELGLFMVASPSLGSRDANALYIFARLIRNSEAEALRFSQSNAWLNDLDKDFLTLKERRDISIRGKELVEDEPITIKKHLGLTTQVVEPFSGARYFGESFKVPYSDHNNIAKPRDRDAIQHKLLVRFISDIKPPLTDSSQITQSETNLESFLVVLRQRVESYSSALNEVIAHLKRASPDQSPEAATTAEQLDALRKQFLSLSDKHLSAVSARDQFLAHEIVGEIHELQSRTEQIVSDWGGGIARAWFSGLRRRYITAPTEREDPEYHEVRRSVGELHRATVERLHLLTYPGDAPPATPLEISQLAFEKL
jgi:hypothetical protein